MKFVSMTLTNRGVLPDSELQSCCFTRLDPLISYTRGTGQHYLDNKTLERLFKESPSAIPIVSRNKHDELIVCGIVSPEGAFTETVVLKLTCKEMHLKELHIPADALGCCLLNSGYESCELLLSGALCRIVLEFGSDSGEHFRFFVFKSGYEVSLCRTMLPSDYVGIP